jgi:choline kinase
MKAVILAAGRGSRLGELTSKIPKCLLEFKSKTLLEHSLTNLRKYFSDDDIVIIGGYKFELLNKYHPNLVFNEEWASTNIMGSLMKISQNLLEEEFVVIYSDIYYESSAIESPAVVNLVNFREIWQSRFENPLVDLETFKISSSGKYLEQIGSKPTILSDIDGQFAGIFSINPSLWRLVLNHVPNVKYLDTTTLLNKCLEIGVSIKTVDYSETWVEIDSESDLQAQN